LFTKKASQTWLFFFFLPIYFWFFIYFANKHGYFFPTNMAVFRLAQRSPTWAIALHKGGGPNCQGQFAKEPLQIWISFKRDKRSHYRTYRSAAQYVQ